MLEYRLQSGQKINDLFKDKCNVYYIRKLYLRSKVLCQDIEERPYYEEAEYIHSKINDLNSITIKTYHRTKKGKLFCIAKTYNVTDIKLLDKLFDIISETRVSLIYIRYRTPPNFDCYDLWFYHNFFNFSFIFLILYNLPLSIHHKLINIYKVLSNIMSALNEKGFINKEDQITFSDFLDSHNYNNYYNISGYYSSEWNEDSIKRKVKLFQVIEKYKNLTGEDY
jgi:hypothetical protein